MLKLTGGKQNKTAATGVSGAASVGQKPGIEPGEGHCGQWRTIGSGREEGRHSVRAIGTTIDKKEKAPGYAAAVSTTGRTGRGADGRHGAEGGPMLYGH